ncbi:ComEC/Rec2 family competence protein [Candidatus Poriferisodalis sp.]|uniref:ComEC/Rec2 family competence protein n=1 Tax=Candidatus Poriferisodalis sp. TaxID=3101277 RepID=UPI003B01886C
MLSAISDRWIVAGAAATAVGALWAPDVPWWCGAAALIAGAARRTRVLLPTGLLLLAAAAMGQQAQNLSEAAGGSFDGEAVIVADPHWRQGALTVPVSVEIQGREHRWEGWSRGAAAYRLEDAAVGEHWKISGVAETAEPRDRPFLWPRHYAGQAQIHTARRTDGGSAPFRLANAVRGLIERSSASLSPRDAALLAGFVYGDDRGQLAEVVHDFRATALTHLLAVSGSNVAFVLLLAAPLLIRLRPAMRLGAVAVLLGQFAVLTRGEPSVLRACVLATLAVGAQSLGRRASAVRLLALAIIVLLLIDPLLVRSVGFQLSVAATAAIVAGTRRIAALLWGPQWIRLPLAATLAAQIGVLPVQLAVFGSLPLVSIPANVLAGPLAGPAMVWGLVAGLAGGLAGDAVASFLHLPTQVMLGWVAAVARWGAAAGWPQIETSEVAAVAIVVVACVATALLARRRFAGAPAIAVVAAAIGIWIVASGQRAALPSSEHLSVGGIDPTVVVIDRPDAARALDQLATAGIDDIDVLIARSASRAGREAVRAVHERHSVARVLAPVSLGGLVQYSAVTGPTPVGDLVVDAIGERLSVSPAVASP